MVDILLIVDTFPSVDTLIVYVLMVEPDAVENNKFFSTLTSFTNCVRAVFIRIDDAVRSSREPVLIRGTLMTFALIVSPVMVMNPIFVAVRTPAVLDVKVLMVEPVAVEKNKFCATKLRATYISRLTLIRFVEILIRLEAVI
jgi:hypothetical protein